MDISVEDLFSFLEFIFHPRFQVFVIVQFIAPALHPIGAGVGDVFPFVAPPDFVAPPLHLPYKVLPIHTYFHGFPDVVHEPEFPALSFPGCPVFPVRHLPSAPLVGGQNGELMLHADLVADLTELPQGGGCLVQLHSRFKADGVDHKVGVYMLGIAVGGHLHLMPRPSFGCEFQTDCVRLFVSDLFFGRKGLHVLVEIDAIQLVVGGLGCQKFCERIGSIAVQSGHISDASFRVCGLVLPLAISHHRLHGADMLFGLLDVGYSCQPLPPMRTSSS